VTLDRREIAVLAAGLVVYAALTVSGLRGTSATFDEGAHLPAGYTYWARGDYRINPEHPPFVKLLAAAPLLALDVTLKPWESLRQWELGRRFLYHWNDADTLLFYGRLPIVALGAALGALVYLQARRSYGRRVAALALLLCVLSPDVLAHGQLVTTDVAIALFSFASVVALEASLERGTAARLAALALAFALACATKFSAVLFVPILAALALSSRSRPRLGAAAAVSVAMLVTAYVVIWACYGFRFAAWNEPAPAFDWTRVLPESGVVGSAAIFARDHHVLPEALIYGFLRFFKAQEARPAFLMGQISDEGWWYYFPATFVLKTPVPLLILLVAALVLAVRRREARSEWVWWLPPLLYMAMVMTRSLNIGHRHLLPIYPYLFILAARAAATGLQAGRITRAATVALLAWYAAGTLRVHPHPLAYFNEIAGGPANGYRSLVDSNLDWGQDLKGLKAWMDRRGVAEIKLSYFGSADPDYYGIRCERLPGYLRVPRLASRVQAGDWVAISATNLQGVYLNAEARGLMERVREWTPEEAIGYSILLYRAPADFDVPAEAADAER
jgi:hypothetical protein